MRLSRAMAPFVVLSVVTARGEGGAARCDTPRSAQLIVADACVPLLPEPMRQALAPRLERFRQQTLEGEFKPAPGADPGSPHFVLLDVGSGEVNLPALRRAAPGFPRDRKRGEALTRSRARGGEAPGDLPWVLLDQVSLLTEALRERPGDAESIVDLCAGIAHLSTDAAMPLQTTRLRFLLEVDQASGAARRPNPPDSEVDATHVAQALASARSDWMVRLEGRLRDEARVSSVRVRRLPDPAEAVFEMLLETHAGMEALTRVVLECEGDGNVAGEGDAPRDVSAEGRRRHVVTALRCADRVAPLLETRLESAILLAAGLITTAWHDAGKPALGGSAEAPEIRSPAAGAAIRNDGLVGSRQSSVFHRPDCPHARRLSEVHRVRFESHAQAIAAGRKPCKRCQPTPDDVKPNPPPAAADR